MTTTPPAAPAPEGADPSMEEILASIRRILNDDESEAATEDTAEEKPAEDDVLVLDESMLVAARDEPVPELPAPEPVRVVAPEPVAPPPEVAPPIPLMEIKTPVQAEPRDDAEPPGLVAPEAAAAAAMSVGSLMRSLAAGRATQVYSGGPTLEDIVRAELRPLLKEWLDVNLPPVVERLVRAEIERVVARAVP